VLEVAIGQRGTVVLSFGCQVWREISRIREGGVLGGRWFKEHISQRVGDGSDTFFGSIPGWLGFLCVSGLAVCLIWRRPDGVRWLRCSR
jgi:hypothetical protein